MLHCFSISAKEFVVINNNSAKFILIDRHELRCLNSFRIIFENWALFFAILSYFGAFRLGWSAQNKVGKSKLILNDKKNVQL